MFKGFLDVAPRCEVCGLDYGFADAGDGPAVFVTLIAGFLVLGAALLVDVEYEPPLWVYVVFFLPLTLLVCLGLLRPLKGVLIASQYKNKAAPGTTGQPDEPAWSGGRGAGDAGRRRAC